VSDYHIGVSENESTSPSSPRDKEPGTGPVNRIANITSKWLEHNDAIIHGVNGISFLEAFSRLEPGSPLQRWTIPDSRGLIELGVDALVILVLGITLKLLGKLAKEN
jgi:hypothetical protein